MRRALALSGLAVLAACVMTASILWTQRHVEVVLVKTELPKALWPDYAAAIAETRPPVGPEADRLRTAVTEINRAELRALLSPDADPTTDAQVIRASQAFQDAATNLLELQGAERYVAVGRSLGIRAIDTMAAAFEEAKRQGRPIRVLLAQPHPTDTVREAMVAAGPLIIHLAATGLIVDRVLPVERRPFVMALYLEHWDRAVAHRMPVDGYLRPEEIEWMQRYRVEWGAAVPVQQRVDAAISLGRIEDYPADLNGGVLLFGARRFDEALRHFKRAEGSRAVAYRRMAERAAER